MAVLGVGAACASVQRAMDSYDMAPNGLTMNEDRLRRALATGRWDSALVRAAQKDKGAPGDRLLRGMYAGLVAYYAGEYERSAGAFERVWELTDDRLTRRLSKEGASLVANDRLLPWTPSPTERLLARHYAMLGFARRGDTGGAAVEARRLVQLLQELDDAGTPIDRDLRALLDYTAAAVFEAAGERNDADVARRNAAALGLADAPRPERDDSATVIVLVEHGWIAHKVERSLSLAFGTRDEIAFYATDDGRRAREAVVEREKAESRAERASARTKTLDMAVDAAPVERLYGLLVDEERDAWYADQWDRPVIVRAAQSTSYLLTLAWPAFVRPEPAPAPMAVTAWSGDALVASDMPVMRADLSGAVVADFRRQRPEIFARALTRAATKYWLSRQAEKKKKWAGALVNAAGDILERADTRSWHLLPGEISLVRLRVPAGTHNLAVNVSDVRRPVPSTLELGAVTVRAGETRLVTGRIWGARGARPPLPVPVRTAADAP